MLLKKECPVCGKIFTYPHWRKNVKCCSRECLGKSFRAKDNMICPACGKSFHRKQSHIDRYLGAQGFYCSIECAKVGRKERMTGNGNHQYGLKGELNCSFKGEEIKKTNHRLTDIYVYSPGHPFANRAGRVTKHRLIVEQNCDKFLCDWFVEIDGVKYLRKDAVVHHKDGNHLNNDIDNLEVLTRAQHASTHNREFENIVDANTGRIIGRKRII